MIGKRCVNTVKNSDLGKTLSRTKAVVDTIKERKIVIFEHIYRMQDDKLTKKGHAWRNRRNMKIRKTEEK